MLSPAETVQRQWPDPDAMPLENASRQRVRMSCYGPLLSCTQQLSMTGIERLTVGILLHGQAA